MFLFDITNNPLAASLAHIAIGQQRVIRELIREQRPQTPVTRAPETRPAPTQSPLTRLLLAVNNIARVAREQQETIFRTVLNNLSELPPQQQGTVVTAIRTARQPAYANLTQLFSTYYRTPEFETQLRNELRSFVAATRRERTRERNNNTVQRTDDTLA